MTQVTLKKSEYEKMQRELSKLYALEAGGVDNWEFYSESLTEWHKEIEVDELLDAVIDSINDIVCDAEVDQPAGHGCGYSITFNEDIMKKAILNHMEEYKEITK